MCETILISDQYINNLCGKKIHENCFIDVSDKEVHEVAEAFKDNNPKVDDIKAVFINAEAKIKGSNRSDLKGIELIFWLRLDCEYKGPIITFGFLSAAQILRLKPQNVVLHAPGNKYWRLGDELKEEEIPKYIENINVNESYRPFIAKYIDLEAVRHKEANWWGIYSLWQCHKVIRKGSFKQPLPGKVQQELNTTNGFLIQHYYAPSAQRMKEFLAKVELERNLNIANLKEKVEKIKGEIESERQKLSEQQSQITEINDDIKYICDKWLPYLDGKAKYEKQNELDVLIELLDEVNTEINSIDNSIATSRSQSEGDEEEIESIERTAIEKIAFESLKDLINSTKKTGSKILLIDDQANDGWADIYKEMFGKDDFGILPIENEIKKIEQSLSSELSKEHEENNPIKYNIILLDLRLIPQSDKNATSIQEISGFQILEYLRDEYPEKLIVVTSASNKIWSYQEVMNMGADAYWIKEGVDNLLDAKDQLGNYLKLKGYINALNNEEYRHYKNLVKKTNQLKLQDQASWWEEKDWGKTCVSVWNNKSNQKEFKNLPQKTKVEKDEFIGILSDGIKVYRNYLSERFILNKIKEESAWVHYSNVGIQMGKIIELVHNQGKDDYEQFGSVGGVLKARKDNNGNNIYKTRNDFAHYENSKLIGFEEFRTMLDRIMTYLTTDPCP